VRLWNGLCPVAGCSICTFETASYIFGQCMHGWNSCLVSWFVKSTVCGTVFQRSLKLIVFSYDSQQHLTWNVAYSHFPGICNSLPQQNTMYLPYCNRYHKPYQFLLYIWKHIRFLIPNTHLKHHNKSQSGSQDVPIHCCFLIFVCRIRWFSMVGISENKCSAHQTSKDYDYEDSSLPGCDTTSTGEWLPKFQINCFTTDGKR